MQLMLPAMDPAVWIWSTVTISGCCAIAAAAITRWGIDRQLRELRKRIDDLYGQG
jgi:hypothetical protein